MPPGTGLMALTTGATVANCTSPTIPAGTALMPQSTMTADRLTISGRISPGEPAAATRISARRVSRARFRVARWQTMTVASRATRSDATGRPTTAERPTITARRPAIGTSYASRMAMTASAVAGTNAGSPRASQPAFVGVAPSTSLPGSMRSTSWRPRSGSPSGWATTMPAIRGSSFRPSIRRRRASVSSARRSGSTPTLRAARSRLAA